MLLISDAAEAFLRSFGRLLEPSTALQMYEGEGYKGYLTSGTAVTTSTLNTITTLYSSTIQMEKIEG